MHPHEDDTEIRPVPVWLTNPPKSSRDKPARLRMDSYQISPNSIDAAGQGIPFTIASENWQRHRLMVGTDTNNAGTVFIAAGNQTTRKFGLAPGALLPMPIEAHHKIQAFGNNAGDYIYVIEESYDANPNE